MAHEQSETVERDGGWINVYGQHTPRAGERLDDRTWSTREAAEGAAQDRSRLYIPGPRGFFTEEGPTEFGTFATDLLGAPPTRDFAAERAALMPERATAKSERKAAVGAVSAEMAKQESEYTTDAAARAKEREAGRAERDVVTRKMTEHAAPTITARPFLAPGAGILNQLQAALVGVTAMATQIRGLSGSAAPAMLAIKGLAEGFATGNREDIDNQWAAWQAANAKLIAEHKAAVEKYRDLVEDQRMSAAEKALMRSQRLKGLEFLAGEKAIDAQDIEAQLRELARAEESERKHVTEIAKLNEMMASHQANEKRLDAVLAEAMRHNRALETQRATDAEERARQRDRDLDIKQQGIDIRERLASDKIKEREAGYTTMASVLKDMDGLVDKLAAKNLLPASSGIMAKGEGLLNRTLDPNDPDWRQWMALQGAMVGYERSVYNDKGARALATYKSLLDFVEHPPTAEGAHAVIKRMQDYLAASAPGGAAPSTPTAAPTLPKGAHREGDDIVSDSGKYIWRDGKWQTR